MKPCTFALVLMFAVFPAAAQELRELSPTAAAGQQILQQLVAGQFDKVEARYNASLAAAIPPGKTAEMWSSLSRQTGPFESIVETKTGKMQGLDVTFVVCKFQKAVLDV